MAAIEVTEAHAGPSRVTERLRGSLAAFRAVLASPDLRRIQLAFVGSEIGSWLAIVALSVLAFGDGGLDGFGLVFGLRMLAPTLAAPFMGILGDRLPRRLVMVAADFSRLVLLGAAAGIVYAGGPLLLAYALVALVGIAGTAFRPAQAALLPSLARTPEELTANNAVSSTIEAAAGFVGPGIAGVVVAVTEPATGLLVAAGTFLWSGLLVRGVVEPDREVAEQSELSARALVRDLRAGVDALLHDRLASLLVALVAVQVVVSGVLFVLIGALAFGRLHGGDELFGILLGAMGVGGLIGAVGSLGMVGGRLLRSFAIATALWGAPIAFLAVWQTRFGALVLIAVVGVANTIVDVAAFTLLQRSIPEHVLSRVFGILESVLYGSTVAGFLLGAPLVHVFGLDGALVAAGLSLPVLVTAAWPALRRCEPSQPAAERIDLLRAVPFLRVLPEPQLEQLAQQATPLELGAGAAIVTQGEEGDRFYVLASGRVEVVADGQVVHEGGPKYSFGEIALLRDEPRIATVRAVTDVSLLSLERNVFLAAVTGHPESRTQADAVAATRLLSTTRQLFAL